MVDIVEEIIVLMVMGTEMAMVMVMVMVAVMAMVEMAVATVVATVAVVMEEVEESENFQTIPRRLYKSNKSRQTSYRFDKCRFRSI